MSNPPYETSPTAVPASAAWLGGSGALPFVTLAAVAHLSPEYGSLALTALHAYGAIILSFLGGVHWGLAMARAPSAPGWSALTLSVAPSLVAWPALLMPRFGGLLVVAGGIVAFMFVDLALTRRGLAPRWYPRLRVPLSVVVALSLVGGALAATDSLL